MQLLFLGTSAGRPTRDRNVTSIALELPERQRFWLFDAGEATQHRLLETRLKLNKLEKIFITHLHGDHLYGLPGLLASRSYHEGAGPLRMYGPPGLRDYLDAVFRLSSGYVDYELDIVEVQSGLTIEDGEYTISVAELDHRVLSFGYRIVGAPRPGPLDSERLARLGVPSGPLYGKLKRGEDVTLADGRIVRSADVVGPATPGVIVTILGDTRPCENAVRLAMNADVLVHEATFAAGMEEKAAAYGHSTALQAAETAARAQVRQLIVTHFSSRYDEEEAVELVNDVKYVHPDIEPARDFLEVRCAPRSQI